MHAPSQTITIAALYHFAHIDDSKAKKEPLLARMEKLDIFGTLMIAEEGINGTISGSADAITALLDDIRSWPGFDTLEAKYSHYHEHPFDKRKVKTRDWVLPFPEKVKPQDERGTYVTPQEWNALIADPEVLTIDTRNGFEVEMGSFDGAVNPDTRNFQDIIDYTQRELTQEKGINKDQKIAMFCTGGIRCEKYSSYLKRQGFNNVYHLQGGILKYLEEIAEKDSKWHGSCFVFDKRLGLKHGLLPDETLPPETFYRYE